MIERKTKYRQSLYADILHNVQINVVVKSDKDFDLCSGRNKNMNTTQNIKLLHQHATSHASGMHFPSSLTEMFNVYGVTLNTTVPTSLSM